jgi:hypothetical protein
MARTGAITLNNLVVQEVLHSKGTSWIEMKSANGQVVVRIEKAGLFADDLNPRPDGTVDVLLSYDPK